VVTIILPHVVRRGKESNKHRSFTLAVLAFNKHIDVVYTHQISTRKRLAAVLCPDVLGELKHFPDYLAA